MADNNNNEQQPVGRDDNILKTSLVFGVLSVPPYMCVINELNEEQLKITTILFFLAIHNSVLNTFVGSNIKGRGLLRSVQDALWTLALYFLGGIFPFIIGRMIPKRDERIPSLIALTTVLMAFILCMDFSRKKQNNQQPRIWEFVVVLLTSVCGIAVTAWMNDVVKHFIPTRKSGKTT